MKLTKVLLFLASIALLCAPAQATLLVDGDFDLATSGTQTSNSPWVLAANRPDGIGNGAQFNTGFANAQNAGVGGPQPPGTGNGVWIRSFEGNQAPGEPTVTAFLFQNVAAPSNGSYTLSFVAGRETNFTATVFDVTLSSGGTGGSASVDLLTAAIPNGTIGGAGTANPGGTPFSLSLTGVTAGDTLTVLARVLGGRDALANPQSAFLDSFVLVPEPGSLSIMILGAVGLLARRRR